MRRFSKCCIALSAAALTAGGFAGQAQSQEVPEEPYRLTAASYSQAGGATDLTFGDIVNFNVQTRLDLVRGRNTLNLRRRVSVTFTSNDADPGTFTDVLLRRDGSYRKKLSNGATIRGTIFGFGSAAFASPSSGDAAGTYTSATYTEGRAPEEANVEAYVVPYDGSNDRGTVWLDVLRSMLYFASLGRRDDPVQGAADRMRDHGSLVTSTAADHITRGNSIHATRRAARFADLRLYVNGVDVLAGDTSFTCIGEECFSSNIPGQRAGEIIFGTGDFVPNSNTQADVVLSNRDIHLVLDRSGFNYAQSPVSFGAWMDDAGFFIAPGGSLVDQNDDSVTYAAQMAVAAGERTGSAPSGDATWRGSMVGTFVAGDNRNNLLRGDARLVFDMEDSSLWADFSYIRDYDRFAALHRFAEVKRRNRKHRLIFKDIPVADDGSYAKTYDTGGGIRGAFYGDSHGETAGTFDRFGVIGAFGAKKLTTD